MGPVVLLIAGFYLFIASKRQTGLVWNSFDDLMGEDVASFMLATLGGSFIALAAFWGLSYAM